MKAHAVDIDPQWIIPESNFSPAYISSRLSAAPVLVKAFLQSCFNYLYGTTKNLDRERRVASEPYLSSAEIRVIRWLHTRSNGSERKNYGPDCVIAAKAAKYRCNRCKFPDVRVLQLDHVHGRGPGVTKEFECLCANCHVIKSAGQDLLRAG